MNFSCNRAALAEVLSALSEVIPSRSSKPILQTILLRGDNDGALTLAATDLEVALRYRLQPETLSDPEELLLPGLKLCAVVRDEWADTIEFRSHGGRVEITTQHGTYHLTALTGEAFPPMPEIDPSNSVRISGSDLAQAVHRTVFATSRSDTRFALNGVFVSVKKGTTEFAASDTHRLSLVKKKVKNRSGVTGEGIVVTKGITSVGKLAAAEDEVRLQLTGQQLLAESSSAALATRLVDGQFPRYQEVIPKDLQTAVTVERDLLLKALRVGGQLASEDTRCVSLAAGDNRLLVSVSGSEVGDAKMEIDAQIDGPEFSAAFNYVYIVDVLRILDDEKVTIQFKDADHPARIDVGDFTHVIMPIRPQG